MRKIYLCLLTSIIFSSSIYANKNVQWHLAMDWKTTHTSIASTSFRVAQLVKEMSNERFIIKIDGREKHNSESSILHLVQKNSYQMGHTNSQQYKNLDINAIWFTSTPLGMTTKEPNVWFYYGNGQKFMNKVYDKFDVLSFPGGDLGPLNGGWFNKKITSIEDFKNLKITGDGIENELLMMHGVIVKKIPLNQIKDRFIKGDLNVINGTSPSIDIKMGYHKIAPYYYTSWDRPASQTQFIVNKKEFEKLSKSYQSILQTAIKMASFELYYENFYANSKGWAKILHHYPNIKVNKFPASVIRELRKTKKIVFEQYSKENKLFHEIYQDQKKFLKNIRKWSTLEEYQYLKTLEEIN